jgi:two-component sensor histidine kinase
VIGEFLDRLHGREQLNNYEARLRRKDGSIRHVLISSNVYFEDGEFVHTRCFTSDITERKQAEIVIGGQKQALELIAEGAPLAPVLEVLVRTVEARSVHGALASILLLDDGLHLRHGAAPSLPESYNRAIDGLTVGVAAGWCGTAAQWRRAVIVTDIARDPLWEGCRELALEHGLRACWSAPILARDDRVLGVYAIYHRQPHRPSAADLQVIEVLSRTAAIAIEAKRAERQERLLIEELNHRVKNTLAVVQAIAHQTFRNGDASDAARRAFEGRLIALSTAHDLLTQSNWESASLRDIAADTFVSQGADGRRLSLDGPDIHLAPKQALALALALHELCTNAVKYGALSNEAGRIGIRWARKSGRALNIEWTETGGPAVSEPERRGFGSRLIEQSLARDLDARVKLDFHPTGVRCTIDAQLPAEQ